MSTNTDEAFEAICAALYNTEFEPIGEIERDGWYTSYFHRGVKPKDIRVGVRRHTLFGSDQIEVVVEWRNLSLGAVLKGQQVFHLSTPSTANRGDLIRQSTALVVDVLNVYRQVLAGDGVAGPISKLVETREDVDDSEDEG